MKHMIAIILLALASSTVNASSQSQVESNTQSIANNAGRIHGVESYSYSNRNAIVGLHRAVSYEFSSLRGSVAGTDYTLASRIDNVIDLVAQQRTYLTGLISNNTALAALTDDHISVAVGGQKGSASLAIGSAFKVGNFTIQLRTAYNSGIRQRTSSLGIGYSF